MSSTTTDRVRSVFRENPFLPLLLVLGLFIVLAPILRNIGLTATILLDGLFLLIPIAVIRSTVLNKPSVMARARVLYVLTLLSFILTYFDIGGVVTDLVAYLFASAFFLLSAYSVLGFVLENAPVTTNRIFAALCLYVFIGLIWALFYAMISLVDPQAFAHSNRPETYSADKPLADVTYYSYITLTTVGYGDITPVNRVAKSLAVLEGLTGQLYLAVLIARLVGLHIAHAPRKEG